MDANSMTPQQLRKLADEKEENSKPIKEGFLKEDLYSFDGDSSNYNAYFIKHRDFWLYSKKTKDEIIKDFASKFALVLKAGTKFVCFLDKGKETWFDDVNYGVESMSEEWAEKYLVNIQKV